MASFEDSLKDIADVEGEAAAAKDHGTKPLGSSAAGPLDRFRNRSLAKMRPLQASIELTYRCNERCTHCYIDRFVDDKRRVLSLEQWYKVLHELREAGVLYLVLMGGEAMLNPLFHDVAKRGWELGFHVSMISNGLKIDSLEAAKKLASSGVSIVSFSLYSLDPETHDKMTRVPGSLERLQRAINFCDQAGVQPSINVLLTEANARGVFDIYDWGARRGFEVKVDPTVTPKLSGNLAPTKYRATRETLLWFFREKARRWPAGAPQSYQEVASNYVCNAAKGKCAVNPYGELLPCIEIRQSLGSLVEQSFDEIWNTPSVDKYRNLKVKDLSNTGGLGTYSYCDHCPGMALHEHGNGAKVTPFSRMLSEVKRQVAEELRTMGTMERASV